MDFGLVGLHMASVLLSVSSLLASPGIDSISNINRGPDIKTSENTDNKRHGEYKPHLVLMVKI